MLNVDRVGRYVKSWEEKTTAKLSRSLRKIQMI